MSATAGEGCAALVGSWLLSWPAGAVRAAVAMKGWEWFVADTFGAPTLGFVDAWGLFLLISFATLNIHQADTDTPPFELMVRSIVASLLFSGIAFASLLILAGLR